MIRILVVHSLDGKGAQMLLIVSMEAERLTALAGLLEESGHEVIAALGFDEAVRAVVDYSPALLISELRLGNFNGLHLVIRSHETHPNMRTILVDSAYDSVLEFEAHRHGAVYLAEPVDETELLAQISRITGETSKSRRWPRKQLAGGLLVGQVAHRSVRVVDLSYGGLRFEVLEPADLVSGFEITLPALGVGIHAKPVWSHVTPSGECWCGAELMDNDPLVVSAWRTLVDSVHAAA